MPCFAGCAPAGYATSVTIDDDLQHPPEEIPRLLARLAEGEDVVYGTPIKQAHTLWRNLASTITRLALQGAMGIENARKVSAFRALRTQIRGAFEGYQSPFVILDLLLTWGTTRFSAVATRHDARQRGVSNYNFSKLIVLGINMLTSFTVLPLQLASLMGFAFALFGLLVLLYVIVRFISGRWQRAGLSVPGVDHRHLFGRPAVRPGHHRRIPGAHALPHHG